LIDIRPAQPSDESALGSLGAALMRQHHASDLKRFILTQHPDVGYGRFLVSQLANPDCLVLAAETAYCNRYTKSGASTNVTVLKSLIST
jgi:hypothetical protein